jgi:serine/threonine protein kinase
VNAAIRSRWIEVESLFETLIDLDPEHRLDRLTEVALVDIDLANAAAELLAADAVERSALDLDAALLVAAVVEASGALLVEAESAAELGASPRLPRYIGPYRVSRRVGHGSTGEVFEATRNGERVALKRLHHRHGGGEIERRFARESEILAKLDHPAIARPLDSGRDAHGCAYLVLEWVEGTDIVSFARDRQLPQVERLRLFLRLCEAVESAHRQRVLHRDLKPSNVLVNEAGWPKLLDFGIAKALDETGNGRETASGVWLFTLDYAAPEQILGRRPGPAADQFSLAVILFEMIAGKRPLHRGGQPISRVLREAGRERLPRLPWGDRDLRAIVARALSADPGDRHPSVGEFADAIALWLAERAPAAH